MKIKYLIPWLVKDCQLLHYAPGRQEESQMSHTQNIFSDNEDRQCQSVHEAHNRKGISSSRILKLQMQNEKEWIYISICLYIYNIYIIYHERHASSIVATVLQYNTQGSVSSCDRQTVNVPYLLHCSEMLEPGKKLDYTPCHISQGRPYVSMQCPNFENAQYRKQVQHQGSWDAALNMLTQ